MFGKSPRVSAGASPLPFNLLLRSPQISWRRDFADEEPWLVLFSDGPLFSLMLAWRSAALVNRTRRIGPKTFVLFRKINEDSSGSVSCNTQPQLSHIFHNSHCTFATTLLRLFFLVVPQASSAESSTYRRIYIPFRTGNLVQVPFKKPLHGCRLVFAVGFLPLRFLFCSAHFYLFVLVAQRMERFLVLISHAHDCRAGKSIGLLSNTDPFAFHW